MGQLTLLVCTALSLSLYALYNRQYLRAALPGAIVIWKPHLLLPLLLVVALFALKNRTIKLFGFVTVTGICCAAYPLLWEIDIYSHWRAMDFSPLAYRTATVVAFTREIVEAFTGNASQLPALILPAIASLGAVFWFLKKDSATFSATQLFALLTVSITFAPYAWPYDFVLLLPIQITACGVLTQSNLTGNRQTLGWGALFLPQILFLIQGGFTDSLGAGCWFPFALFGSWLYIKRSCSFNDQFVAPGPEK
jgi:hypothetical protein